MDFVAVDVETANADRASICQVGLVWFRAGVPSDRLTFLVDPEDEFDGFNTSVHGIDANAVAGKPALRDVLPVIADAVAGQVVVHHSAFDRVALGRAVDRFGLPAMDCRWLDSCRLARRAWADRVEGYGLASLAAGLGIAFRHHDAGEDAVAAGTIVVMACRAAGYGLEEAIAAATAMAGGFGGENATRALAGNPHGLLFGEVVIFTGTLAMPRREAAALAASVGCRIATSVGRKTTLVVLGDQDVRVLSRGQTKSEKHRAAEALMAAGAELKIIGEADFRFLMAIASR